jgi:hypothetical protein
VAEKRLRDACWSIVTGLRIWIFYPGLRQYLMKASDEEQDAWARLLANPKIKFRR